MSNKYPEAFLKNMQSALCAEYPAFLKSLDAAAPTSVRLNPMKGISFFPDEEKIPWCYLGRYLVERPSFTFDPSFHAGAYYVQEASSMFLEKIWEQIPFRDRAIRVLDLCAAPGGKSTHLLSLLSPESLLVCNEPVPARNKVLQQNIIKWGYPNCIVTQNKPEDFSFLGEYFDLILVDAPCSGEGLFRRDEDAIGEWSLENVAMCSARQKKILADAAACLKPGGYLIYATCTFEPEENDANMAWLRGLGFSICRLESVSDSIQSTAFGLQFYPHRVKGEGFYIALMKKDGEENFDEPEDRSKKFGILQGSGPPASGVRGSAERQNDKFLLNNWLSEPASFTTVVRNNILFAIPREILPEFEKFEKQLYLRHAGIPLGEFKGTDFLPSPALALSNFLHPGPPGIDLDKEQAITFLRGEAPRVTADKGWCLARYNGLGLGWMKSLGNRVNNYYPKEWRILKR